MRPLAPKGGNDRVYTPPALAERIVRHFKPEGRILEPCRGLGAFSDAMPGCEWCEINDGCDFFDVLERYDWIVTNPPWSQFRSFMRKSMEVSRDVVFLSLVNAFFMRRRVQDMSEAGFGIVEIVMIPTPKKPWPQTGFQLGATRFSHAYAGSIKITHW